MASDGATANRSLVTRCGHDDYTSSSGMIERLFQRKPPFGRRLSDGKTQIQYACTSLNALEDCGREFLERGVGQLCTPESRFSKDRAHEESTIWANGRGG
jgi:hypothetical protein